MTTHHLKCWPVYFDRLQDGTKTFEIRFNDRDYQTGDYLDIQEWKPRDDHGAPVGVSMTSREGGMYTGRTLAMQISYIYSGIGVDHGFVVLGLRNAETP